MRHEFHPEALTEYEGAALYYMERDPAVGQQFIEAVENALDRILDSPTRWRVLEEDVHRCLTRVFPYGVLYTIEPDFVLIVAVMHCSREPGYWKRRVAKLSRSSRRGRSAARLTGRAFGFSDEVASLGTCGDNQWSC